MIQTVKLTPNQVVAYNLMAARALRGWTQEQAAEKLEPYLGTRWSKATFSAAERSVSGERIREFTADELFAFTRGFDLPLWWFFLPPTADATGVLPLIDAPDVPKDEGLVPGILTAIIFGSEAGRVAARKALGDRLAALPGELRGPLSHAMAELYGDELVALARQVLKDVRSWPNKLRDVADNIEFLHGEAMARALDLKHRTKSNAEFRRIMRTPFDKAPKRSRGSGRGPGKGK